MGHHAHAAFCVELAFQLLQLAQGPVFADGELRAYVGGAHAADRILLRVSYIIGVMTFDVATQRTYLGREPAGHLSVKDGGIQVCSHLSHNEARPHVGQSDNH